MRLVLSVLGRYRPAPPLKSHSTAKWSKVYANLPERYMLRKTHKLIDKSPPLAGSATFLELSPAGEAGLKRSWGSEYEFNYDYNNPGHGTYVQPIKEEDWMWFKGDRVSLHGK